MTSPVLVTGGTGRLGRSVVARRIDVGQDVRVLARPSAILSRRSHSSQEIFGGVRASTLPCVAPG